MECDECHKELIVGKDTYVVLNRYQPNNTIAVCQDCETTLENNYNEKERQDVNKEG